MLILIITKKKNIENKQFTNNNNQNKTAGWLKQIKPKNNRIYIKNNKEYISKECLSNDVRLPV